MDANTRSKIDTRDSLTIRKAKKLFLEAFLFTAITVAILLVFRSDRALSLDGDVRSALVYRELWVMTAVMWAWLLAEAFFRRSRISAAVGKLKLGDAQAAWARKRLVPGLVASFFGKSIMISICMIAVVAILAAFYAPVSAVFDIHAAFGPFLWTAVNAAFVTFLCSGIVVVALTVFLIILAPGDGIEDKIAFEESFHAAIAERELAYEAWKAKKAEDPS